MDSLSEEPPLVFPTSQTTEKNLKQNTIGFTTKSKSSEKSKKANVSQETTEKNRKRKSSGTNQTEKNLSGKISSPS